MGISAAEKIQLAEKKASEDIANEKARLEKEFKEYARKSEQAFKSFSGEILARTENTKKLALEDIKKEVFAIRRKRKMELGRLESISKKNQKKAVAAFVRIAGSWEGA